METTRELLPAGLVLAEVGALLDRVDPDRSLLTNAERLALVEQARQVSGRVQALAAVVASEAEAGQASRTRVRLVAGHVAGVHAEADPAGGAAAGGAGPRSRPVR